MKLWRLPKIEGSILKFREFLPFAHLKRVTTFGKGAKKVRFFLLGLYFNLSEWPCFMPLQIGRTNQWGEGDNM